VNLAFVSRTIGNQSEVWMWRQLTNFRKLIPHIITWEYVNSELFGLDGLPLQVLPFELRPEEMPGLGRWIYRLKCAPGLNFYASIGAERRFILKVLSEIKPKIILCHFGHTALRMLPIAREQRIPIVVHFHGLDLSSSLYNRWYRWSLLLALKNFSEIVVVGSHQKKWVIKHGVPENRVHLIPCGVPTQIFKYKVRQLSKKIQFICVCRLVESKGVEYCIRAFAQVLKEIGDGRLLIVGGGPLQLKLEALSHWLGLNKYITFTGPVFPNKVIEYLAESDIFVQHSVFASDGSVEGFGVSIAEAAATGLPVVSTRCGGIEDQVIDKKTGFLVEQRDVNAMANCMVRLALDPALRKKIGKAGREHMVASFDAQKQISKLESVLLDCYRK